MSQPSARAFQSTAKAEPRNDNAPDWWGYSFKAVQPWSPAHSVAAVLGLTQFFLEIAHYEREGWPVHAWAPPKPCEECTRRRDQGKRHGIYLQECHFARDGDDVKKVREKERSYGPYCSPRCVRIAVHRDNVVRTRTYTMGQYTAKTAKLFHANAIDPFKAKELADAAKSDRKG